ncbi:MAG TPA: OmpA family protein [Polyangia bacterium]|jgi:peptidoglycan-associated lipoprotein
MATTSARRYWGGATALLFLGIADLVVLNARIAPGWVRERARAAGVDRTPAAAASPAVSPPATPPTAVASPPRAPEPAAPAAAQAPEPAAARAATPAAAGVAAGPRLAPPIRPIRFASSSADLSERGRQKLARAARALKAHPGLRLTVRGHSDDRGGAEARAQISLARARAAAAALVAAGVSAERLEVVGAGSDEPAARGSGEGARALSRRVELIWAGELARQDPGR